MENFNENIQLVKPVQISGVTLARPTDFYVDSNKESTLYLCQELKEIIDIIDFYPPSCWTLIQPRELYLPLNKKRLSVEETLRCIKDDIIDLSMDNGKEEARNRFVILASLLRKQKSGQLGILDVFGCPTRIGDFKFPNGELRFISVNWKSDHGENGAWWFGVCSNDRYERFDSAYWFSFSSELKGLVNSDYK